MPYCTTLFRADQTQAQLPSANQGARSRPVRANVRPGLGRPGPMGADSTPQHPAGATREPGPQSPATGRCSPAPRGRRQKPARDWKSPSESVPRRRLWTDGGWQHAVCLCAPCVKQCSFMPAVTRHLSLVSPQAQAKIDSRWLYSACRVQRGQLPFWQFIRRLGYLPRSRQRTDWKEVVLSWIYICVLMEKVSQGGGHWLGPF